MSNQIGLFGQAPETESKKSTQTENIVVWDLETQNTFNEVGGRQNIHKLKISCGVAYSSQDQKYHRYLENEIPSLVELLKTASLSIGFNTKGFDIPVLSSYMPPGSIDHVNQLDMLEKIYLKHRFRIGLGNIAAATLGEGKSANGLEALEWFKQGLVEKVMDYCQQDVKVTKEVYEFGRDNGFIFFTPKGSADKRKLEISW